MKRLLLLLAFFPLFSTAQFDEVGWYSYPYSLGEYWGTEMGYYYTYIYPDTTVTVGYSDGIGSPWMHGIGQVFDPKSTWWDNGVDIQLTEDEPYMVDSVRVWYRYFRIQEEAPDTLILQFFKQENIENFYEDPWEGDPTYGGRSYARIDYDTTLLRSANPYLEIEELLDYEDVFEGNTSKSYFIGEPINAGEVVALSATYLPGNPNNVGDTLDWFFDQVQTNYINAFQAYYFADDDLVYETGDYNHGIIAGGSARYADNSNGWAGQYWPGIASGGSLYHADMDFHISKGTHIQEEAGSLTMLNAFPNPASDLLTFKFLMAESDRVKMQITDTQGRVVVDENWGNLSGEQTRQLMINHLQTGTYFYSFLTDNGLTSGSFVKR